ncbi:ABC transporter permease [soil metagenome]
MPLGSWRLVGRRSLADRLVIAVAWLVMVAAVTLLAAGAMYSDAVARSGLLRSLNEAGSLEANVQVVAQMPALEADGADALVRAQLGAALGAAADQIVATGRSESFALPDQPTEVRDLTLFAFAEGLDGHATLVDGSWPVAGGTPLETAVSQAAAERLSLSVGNQLELASRLDAQRVVAVRVAAIFSINDRADPYWWTEPLDLEGVSEGATFTTHGPLFLPRVDFLAQTIVHRADLRWRAFPQLEAIAAGNMDGLRNRVGSLQGRLQADLEGATSVRVDSGLPQLLATAGSSLLVSRAGVLLLNIQLAVLAGYALLLVGALIVEQRRAETALLRSRGASAVQIFRFALMEAFLLVVPAALAAPLLAIAVLEVFEQIGPLAGTGLSLRPQVTQDAALLGGIACVISLLALALPGLAAVGPLSSVRRAVGRQLQRTLPQRLGLDVALVTLAAIGLWQLQQYGAPLTRSMRGSLGVDPLLIAAPTIGLLAGAILALRILPLLARGLEDLVARRQGMGTSLGARQLARRPLRYTRAALLLIVASSIGIFAATYGATWAQSQRDQVDYAVGADVRTTSRNQAAPAWAVSAAHLQLDGVGASLPVVRESFQLGRSGGRGTLLAVPPEGATAIVKFRSDMSDTTLESAMGALAGARPPVAVVTLPAETRRLALDIEVTLEGVDGAGRPVQLPAAWPGVSASAVLRDGQGLVHRFAAETRVGTGTSTAVVPLVAQLPDGESGTPGGRLDLVAVEMAVTPMPSATLGGTLRLAAARASTAPAGDDWTDVGLDIAAGEWQAAQLDANGLSSTLPEAARIAGGVAFTDANPLVGSSEARFSVRPELPGGTTAPVPALVNAVFLDATGAALGDQIAIGEQFSTTRRIVVAGVVRGFPTLNPDEPLAILDLPSAALADYAERSRLLLAPEWWLESPDADPEVLGSALRGQPFAAAEVAIHRAELATRVGDPIALGVVGALALGSAAAWFFAALGFVVSAVVAARERLSEFALLRALGLSRRQLAMSLSLENAFLLLISLAVGVTLGAVLSWVVLPSVTLTAQGTPPLPQVRIALPWDMLALLVAFGAVLLAVTLLVLRRLASDAGLGSLLRMRDE